MLADAAGAKTEIDALAHQLAEQFGGTVKEAPLKKTERIVDKTIEEKGGNLSKIKDVARNTIVVPQSQVAGVVDALAARPETTYKYQSPEDFHGYSGHLFNVKTSNGHIAEIQVNTPEMMAAKKEGGHALYKLWRSAVVEHGQNSPEAAALATQMRAHYAPAN